MSSSKPHDQDPDSEPEMLDADDALEEVESGEEDVAMDSGDEDDDQEEITLVNDSIAYFDTHKDSVFAIAQHPLYPTLIATGGSEGSDDDSPGKGYLLDVSAAFDRSDPRPVLPPSFASDPSAAAAQAAQAAQAQQSTQLAKLFDIDGHTDSINALAFTLPKGDFLLSGGMDGRLRTYALRAGTAPGRTDTKFKFLAEVQEVPEVNWIAPCPVPSPSSTRPHNSFALGAADGSVWVYTIDAKDRAAPLQIVQSYFAHTAPCTAGVWTPDGSLLATVAEDSSLCVWDVWGLGLGKDNGAVVSLTGEDARFAVEGGLYAATVSPGGNLLAVGGAGGIIKVVGLPKTDGSAQQAQPQSSKKGGRQARPGEASGQVGTIIASLQVQSDGVESLAFAPAPQTLLAAGSVDGSIAVYDTARSFALRRHMLGAHDEFSVVKVEWVRDAGAGTQAPWLLTSCGMDGVVRRWDLRNPAVAAIKEWRGHRGDGEGGGVLGFVQGEDGARVVTAGDDGVVLVFEA